MPPTNTFLRQASWPARWAWSRLRSLAEGPWFPHLERIGVHVTRVGFASPIPDTRDIAARRVWSARSDLHGVDLRETAQIALLRHFHDQYAGEYGDLDGATGPGGTTFRMLNGYYETVDAETLYCFVRDRKPARVIEIGCGNSTVLIARALARNAAEGHAAEYTAVDPFPRPFLHALLTERDRLLAQPVQEVPLETFATLGPGDILFIDSSHVVKTGSDVCYEFLEILPRLRQGVAVHIHDIFLPDEYPRRWLMDAHYFWNEQYLLQAFLAFNSSFRVLWAGRFMHIQHPALLRTAFPSYAEHAGDSFPASFWIERHS